MIEITGQTLGNYLILERVAHGGMSTIYKARDIAHDTDVAVKVLSAAMASDPTFEARFSREIGVLRTLDHPHILPIIDYGEIVGLAYIVMPFYPHGTLQNLIDQGFPIEQGVKIIDQVSEALCFAHAQGITHRDVKPSNVLLDENGDAVLSDFGFAHMSDSSLSLTGSALIGTPAYMSPEQCRGEEIDGSSDQYSLGVVLYQMLTGQLPFEAETPMALVFKHLNDPVPNPSDINPEISEAVEDVLLKALDKNPHRRFPSIEAMNQAFRNAVDRKRSTERGGVIRLRELSQRVRRAGRRMSRSISAHVRTTKFQKRVRIGLALSILMVVPAAIWALSIFGMGRGAAASVTHFVTQNPTDFMASVYDYMTQYPPGVGTTISQEDLLATAAATLSVHDLVESTPTPTTLPAQTPTPTNTSIPWYPNPTATQPSYVTPSTTPTSLPLMSISGIIEIDASMKDGGWEAVVEVSISGEGSPKLNNATVIGTWSAFGEGVEVECVTSGPNPGACTISSGIIIDAETTTFTVTDVTHANFQWDGIPAEIQVVKP